MRKTILALVAILAVLFVSCGGGGNDESHVTDIPEVKSVKFSEKNVLLHLYEKKLITANVLPEQAKPYFSGIQCNPIDEVIRIDGPNETRDSIIIQGCQVGATYLTTEAGGLSDTCYVTVTDEPVAVQNITFDKNEFELYEGESYSLQVAISPTFATDSLQWRTDDSDVVKVGLDQNLPWEGRRWTGISAQKPGITYVTATTKDGFVAKCKVTVKGIKQINLNKSEIELYDGKSVNLNVTVIPEGATAKNIIWTTENEEIATVYSRENSNMYEPFKVCITGGRPGVTSVIGTSYDGKVVTKCKVTVKNNNSIEYHPFDDDEQW